MKQQKADANLRDTSGITKSRMDDPPAGNVAEMGENNHVSDAPPASRYDEDFCHGRNFGTDKKDASRSCAEHDKCGRQLKAGSLIYLQREAPIGSTLNNGDLKEQDELIAKKMLSVKAFMVDNEGV